MNLDELVAAFEAGTIDNDEFPHQRHVQVRGVSRNDISGKRLFADWLPESA